MPTDVDSAPVVAQLPSAARKASKMVTNDQLRHVVEDGLSKRWSPEEISHRLVKDYPGDESMRVFFIRTLSVHETIYQAPYFQARGGLKREVAQALRTSRTQRKPLRRRDQRQHRFVDPMIMISDRPAEVEDRAVPGHWEGDLIMGEAKKTAIATLSNAPPATPCSCTYPTGITPKPSATGSSPRWPPCRRTCAGH
jgi:IS30 family transposase